MQRSKGRVTRFQHWILWTVCFMILASAATCVHGALLRNVPVTLKQPDGTVIECLASGDEFHNWLHDEDGYTIVQDPDTGYYVYALEGDEDIVPSPYRVGEEDPRALNLKKNVNIAPGRLQDKVLVQRQLLGQAAPAYDVMIVGTPQLGTINNIVIFIRFASDPNFWQDISTYEGMFNSAQSSVNNYFKEASYNQLSIVSHFYPLSSGSVNSYLDSNPREYFMPYSASNTIGYQESERASREHGLLKRAVEAVKSQVPSSLNVDSDADGYVDNVVFVVQGDPNGWGSLLWPHQWNLYSEQVYINGKRVGAYNLQLQKSINVGVLCHEMFHSLGAPDLYHYSQDGKNPVYQWDLMEYQTNPPQHMSAHMKWKYGSWISSIPQITASGTYSLPSLSSSPGSAYRIASPNSSSEYFVVEYRKKEGTFESNLPGEGLLVYRIDAQYQGNANGPPDEVYVYRPGGTLNANGTPAQAHFSSNVSRTQINDSTNPSSFLSSGGPGGLKIYNVGSVGSTITFTVDILGGSTGDEYEPDDTPGEAKNIAVGQMQTRSIHVPADVDWVKFTLTQPGEVRIETNGSVGDTEMWLFGPNSSTSLVEYDNDDGNGSFSLIERTGANALDAGTYYLKIQEVGNNAVISQYTLSLTAGGASQPGAVSVTITPGQAATAGAQWRVDGGAWKNSGQTVSNLAAGSHTLSFKSIAGWVSPTDQAVNIVGGQTTAATGVYQLQKETGTLSVKISPPKAVAAGAQWRVDGGAWKNSGEVLSGLAAGSHTVSFKKIPYWTRPAPQTITTQAGGSVQAAGDYARQPPVVTITATDAVASEPGTNTGKIRVNRKGDRSKPLTVRYKISGTATNGTDYVRLSGKLVIPKGKAFQVIRIIPLDNGKRPEDDETVILTLSPVSSYQVGSPGSATVTIKDDD